MHFINYFTGNLIVKILTLFTLPIISNLLTPEEYGFYSLFMVYVSYATILYTANLLPAISRFWYDDVDKTIFSGTSILASSSIFIVLSLISIIFHESIDKFFNIDFKILILILIFVIFQNIDLVVKQIFVALRKSKLISVLSVIYAMLLFLVTLFYIYFIDKKFSLVYANLTVGLLFSIIYVYYIKDYVKLEFNKNYFKQNMRYSIPLLFDTLAAMLMVTIDKIMLEHYLGVETLGLYSFAYSIGLLLSSVIVFPLLSAWTPNYFEDMNNRNYVKLDNEIYSMTKMITMVSFFMILFYSEFVYLLFNTSYYDGFVILPYIVVSSFALFLWQIYGRSIGYAKKNFYMIMVTVSAGLLNILLNYLFIPKYGMLAASLITLISYSFMAILGYFIAKYIIKSYVFDSKKLFLPILLLFILLIISQKYSIISFDLSIIMQKGIIIVLLISILYCKEIYNIIILNKDRNGNN